MNMSLDSLKAAWNASSTKKKWLIAGGAAALLCAISGLGKNPDMGHNRGPGPQIAYDQVAAPMAYMNQGQNGQVPVPFASNGYAQVGYVNQGGGTAPGGYIAADPASNPYNHPDDTDIMSGFDHNNEVNDRVNHNFALVQRDQTDVQNVATGEVTNEVPNSYATPAIESGAYVAADAPAADDGN